MKHSDTISSSFTLLGLEGTLTQTAVGTSSALGGRPSIFNKPGTWHRQTWVSKPQQIIYEGNKRTMVINVRFDDEFRNGHNTFAITGEIKETSQGGGCWGMIHEQIGVYFPQFAPFFKWHGTSTDGPLHYYANATYLAGDRDCSGYAKGEPCSWDLELYFEDFPIGTEISKGFALWLEGHRQGTFHAAEVPYVKTKDREYDFGPHYTLKCNFNGAQEYDQFTADWTYAKYRTEQRAKEVAQALNTYQWEVKRVPSAFSKGKVRELDLARSAAVWPEATDEQLCLPKEQLLELLEARLPALLVEFREAIETLGLSWAPDPKAFEDGE